jgi:hypothetical protein
MAQRTCSYPGCDDPQVARGLCDTHYRRFRKHGDPSIVLTTQMRGSLEERFRARVDKGDGDGCWLWTGYVLPNGYGQFHDADGRTTYAHRFAYQLFVGSIPERLGLDHECHNRDLTCWSGSACLHRRCVRPDHLIPRTQKENVRRGRSPQTPRRRARRPRRAQDPTTWEGDDPHGNGP